MLTPPHGWLTGAGILLSAIALLFVGYEHIRIGIEFDSIERELARLKSTDHFVASIAGRNRRVLEARFLGPDRAPYLIPTQKGPPVRIQFELGVLSARLEDIKTHPKGSEVTLVLGNPLEVQISGIRARIDWGETDSEGTPTGTKRGSKQIAIARSIRPGARVRIPIVLQGISPEDLGYVRIRELTHWGVHE